MGELLRELRERRGRSLRGAAEDLGIDPAHLSRLERGLKNASQELRERAADYYSVTPDELALASGELPNDVVMILQEHPEMIDEIRDRYDVSE